MDHNRFLAIQYTRLLVGLLTDIKRCDSGRRPLNIFLTVGPECITSRVTGGEALTLSSPKFNPDVGPEIRGDAPQPSCFEPLPLGAAVALVGVPMQASFTNLIRCLLQAGGQFRRAVLLASPLQGELRLIVLCTLGSNADTRRFSSGLESAANRIFKGAKVYACETAGRHVLLDDSESNPCPVCLERLIDTSNPPSLFTLLSWGGIRCPLCRRTHDASSVEETSTRETDGVEAVGRCQECATGEDVFLCLSCGYEGCGRSKLGHAMSHASAKDHPMGLQVATNSVYELGTFRPIYNLTVKPTLDKGAPHQAGSAQYEKAWHFEEIKLLRAQLVSQSQHFDKRLKETDEAHHSLLQRLDELNFGSPSRVEAPECDLRALRSSLAIQKASNLELEAQLKKLKDSRNYYLDRGDVLTKQLSRDKAELEQLKATALKLEHDLNSRLKLLH
ncbi:hypothetical protein L0F63_006341 [Massospora cicadina]|nr:hypothetical protein L0F63_006341 [Massospora cicadina]